MTNHFQNFLRRQIQIPLAVFPLLALLLIFVSSVTHQQASAAPLNHGFTGTLDHLVVASSGESVRVKHGAGDEGGLSADDGDAPLWHNDTSATFLPGWRDSAVVFPGTDERIRSEVRFLIPLLRAPPLA